MSISIRDDVLHFGQQHWCVLEFSIRCGSCSTSERLSPLGCPNLSEFKLVLLSTIAFRLTVLYSYTLLSLTVLYPYTLLSPLCSCYLLLTGWKLCMI